MLPFFRVLKKNNEFFYFLVSVYGGGGAESISRVEFALSEVTSSISGTGSVRPVPPTSPQLLCWITTADLYLKSVIVDVVFLV